MSELSAKARFDIDRALLAGEEGRAIKIHRDDVGGGIGDAITYVAARREALRAERPGSFHSGVGGAAAGGRRAFRGLLLIVVALLLPGLLLLPFELSYEAIERAVNRFDPLVEALFDQATEMARSGDAGPTREGEGGERGEIETVRQAPPPRPPEIPVIARRELPAPQAGTMDEAARALVGARAPERRPQPPTIPAPKPAEGPLPLLNPAPGGLTIDLYRHFRYEPRGFPFKLSTGQRTLTLSASPTPPLEREPAYGGSAHYIGIPLGDGPHAPVAVVLEQAADRWRIHVDRNLNRDLTDDGPPVEQGLGDGKGFGVALDLNLPVEGADIARPYRIWLFTRKAGDGWRAAFYARCHYAARIRLGGEIYTAVAYEQHDQDGRFADDGLWIDLDRNGKLEEGEHFTDGDRIAVGDHEYPLRLAYR